MADDVDFSVAISIHALHEESDPSAEDGRTSPKRFQSTLSMRRATFTGVNWGGVGIFQSTLSMRRATRAARMVLRPACISIHALHEESDDLVRLRFKRRVEFQSTLSMRRATPIT